MIFKDQIGLFMFLPQSDLLSLIIIFCQKKFNHYLTFIKFLVPKKLEKVYFDNRLVCRTILLCHPCIFFNFLLYL
jgi:hypothetical protein